MNNTIGVGYHPITRISTFAQEVRLDVNRSLNPIDLEKILGQSDAALFVARRDEIIENLYDSVKNSCAGIVALCQSPREAEAVVGDVERELGIAAGGQLDYRNLDRSALRIKSRLSQKIEASEGTERGESSHPPRTAPDVADGHSHGLMSPLSFAKKKLQESAESLSHSMAVEGVEKMYPSLISEATEAGIEPLSPHQKIFRLLAKARGWEAGEGTEGRERGISSSEGLASTSPPLQGKQHILGSTGTGKADDVRTPG